MTKEIEKQNISLIPQEVIESKIVVLRNKMLCWIRT